MPLKKLSRVFSTMLPTNPSQTTTSTRLWNRSWPSTLPMKFRFDLLAEFAGFQGQFGAFVRLGAVAQDADAGILVAENLPRVDAAHDGEIEQGARAALDAGAGIQQDEFIFRGGNDGGDAGAVHAGQRAQADGRGSDNAAGVARGNQASAFPSLTNSTARRHRAILFAAQRLHRLVLHGDDFAGVDDSARGIAQPRRVMAACDLVLAAHEEQLGDGGIGSKAILAPSMITSRPWSPPITSTAIRINEKSAESGVPRSPQPIRPSLVTVMTWRPL